TWSCVVASVLPSAPPTLFPYTTLFRSDQQLGAQPAQPVARDDLGKHPQLGALGDRLQLGPTFDFGKRAHVVLAQHGVAARLDERSEEHTSELQSRVDLVCRLLLEKKKR